MNLKRLLQAPSMLRWTSSGSRLAARLRGHDAGRSADAVIGKLLSGSSSVGGSRPPRMAASSDLPPPAASRRYQTDEPTVGLFLGRLEPMGRPHKHSPELRETRGFGWCSTTRRGMRRNGGGSIRRRELGTTIKPSVAGCVRRSVTLASGLADYS
jgi:hypothetical protein